MSKKINRHLRRENGALRARMRELQDLLDEATNRADEAEQELVDAQEGHAIAEARCERNKSALQAEARRERETRENLEYDQWRSQQRSRGIR